MACKMLSWGMAGSGTDRHYLYYSCNFSVPLKEIQNFNHWIVLHNPGCRSCERVRDNSISETMDRKKCF